MKKTISVLLLSVSLLVKSSVSSAAPLALAEAYFQLSVSLAEARNQNRTCEVDSYVTTVIAPLSSAIKLDPTYRTQAKSNHSLKRALGDNLAFNLLIENIPVLEGRDGPGAIEGFRKILSSGITVYGPAQGVFGNRSTMQFGSKGRVEFTQLVAPQGTENPHSLKYQTTVGTYEATRISDVYLIIVDLPGIGRRAYRLGSSEIEGHVKLLDAGNPAPEAPEFTSTPSECSA